MYKPIYIIYTYVYIIVSHDIPLYHLFLLVKSHVFPGGSGDRFLRSHAVCPKEGDRNSDDPVAGDMRTWRLKAPSWCREQHSENDVGCVSYI